MRAGALAAAALLALAAGVLPACETPAATYSPAEVSEAASQACERSGYVRGTAEHFHCAASIIQRIY